MRIKRYSEHFPRNLFDLIPENCQIYLDVGCAAGLLGKALKERNENVEVYGVEINPEYAQRAEKYVDGVVCGDVEEIDLGAINKKFDCIIYADILEHLKDPWTTLGKHKAVLSQEDLISFYKKNGFVPFSPKYGDDLLVYYPKSKDWKSENI